MKFFLASKTNELSRYTQTEEKGNVEIHTNAMAKGVEERPDGVTVTFEVKAKKKLLMLITY